MLPLVTQKHKDVERLCHEFRVDRLELFGGAARSEDGVPRDLDFLVRFLPQPAGEHADNYFGLLAALEDLFQSPVDLVEMDAVKNPYFLAEAAKSRTLMYAA